MVYVIQPVGMALEDVSQGQGAWTRYGKDVMQDLILGFVNVNRIKRPKHADANVPSHCCPFKG
jgi:hypothetical protein